MSRPAPVSLGAFVVVVAALSLTVAIEAGQFKSARSTTTSTAPAGGWKPPLTADGHPDLQGIWLNNFATPLERPKQLEGRQFLTDEEVAAMTRNAERLFSDGNADFAGGDAVFISALSNIDKFKSAGSTGSSAEMIERTFDNRTSLIVDPPDGRIPALTAAARQRNATFARSKLPTDPAGPEDFASDIRCITFGTPRVGGNYAAGHFGYYQIVQTPQFVVVQTEAIHEARIIPLDGRAHLPKGLRQWNGDSRGRWDGSALVIETTNFSPQSFILGSADGLHLTERFTRVAADMVNYEITFDDPSTWERPWTALMRMKHTDEQIYEFACHEGNYDIMRGMLGGARVVEQKGFNVESRKR